MERAVSDAEMNDLDWPVDPSAGINGQDKSIRKEGAVQREAALEELGLQARLVSIELLRRISR